MSQSSLSITKNALIQKDQCNILIIDDNLADRTLYKQYIKQHNSDLELVFHEAINGEAGFDMFNTVDFDCILLDYRLPDCTGLELIKKMAKQKSTLPVVMLTGQGDEDTAAETIKSGAQNYISKNTLTAESLQSAVANTIDRAYLLAQVEIQNEQLKIAKEKAEQADKSKSDFLATMSHEIRTPLNGIIGMVELLQYTPLTEKQEQYLTSINSSGELLLAIINDILDFSKIEAGDMEFESRHINLESLLREITQLLGNRANESQVEIVINWPEDNNVPVIMGDPVRIRQIFINLLGNAIKFTQDGHVCIHVIIKEQDNNNASLRFKVEDTGIGIPEDKLNTIFEQFSQVDSSTTRHYGGTGLGLAICRRLLRLMDSDLSVESTVGEGTTFWFDLDMPVFQHGDIEPYTTKGTLNGKKVLIVDDNKINRDLYESYMAYAGANISSTDSAQNALEIISQAHSNDEGFDVIVIDYNMPEMNGEDLSSTIKNDPEKYGDPDRILLLSVAKRQSSDMLKQAGFYDVLLKPIFPEILIQTVIKHQDTKIEKADNNTAHTNQDNDKLPDINAHALVVDDDRISMRMTRSILDKLGCTYDTAENGQEALDILTDNHSKYDIVFMDWQMPVMDGHEAIKNIRLADWGKDIKIVALTANAIQGDREKCINAGANDYVSKPVRIGNIIDVITTHVENA